MAPESRAGQVEVPTGRLVASVGRALERPRRWCRLLRGAPFAGPALRGNHSVTSVQGGQLSAAMNLSNLLLGIVIAKDE